VPPPAPAAASAVTAAAALRVSELVGERGGVAVVVFSKTFCPFCDRVKELLKGLKGGGGGTAGAAGVAPVVVVELDEEENEEGEALAAELAARTGRSTVPSVWVRGTFVGGCNDVVALAEAGKLAPLLAGTKPSSEATEAAAAAAAGGVDDAAAVAAVRAGFSAGCAAAAGPRAPGEKLPVQGDAEALMAPKAHGTSAAPVQDPLRYGVDRAVADQICSFNRHYAEHSGYFEGTSWLKEVAPAAASASSASADADADAAEQPVTYYDSVTGKPLFVAPIGRSFAEFAAESAAHGWPSFRDEEVVWENVRCLPDGECVSVDGTHLGHNLPSGGAVVRGGQQQQRGVVVDRRKRNRYCINLVSVAGNPV